MRYATFSLPNDPSVRLGLARGNTVIDVHALVSGKTGEAVPRTLPELIQQGRDTWKRIAQLVNQTLAGNPPSAVVHGAAEVRWHAPILRPPAAEV